MPFLGLFIAVVCLFTFFRKRSNRSQENVTDRFWKRESIANNTRLQDLSGLPYITIPFDKFPIGMYENDLLKNYENTLQTLSGQKIVNFGTQTNTDLKITYGTASPDGIRTKFYHTLSDAYRLCRAAFRTRSYR